MKNLRRISIAFAFTLALTIPAFAGEIDTTKTSPPPSQPTQTATVNGEIETGITGQDEMSSGEVSATDSATTAVLNLLQTVLALF
ncbi:MAG: hypothetical protein QOH49_4615 [Acidobacteriota bacterium]|jgi:hypothetical protein|nr:hypothetical protein [Acidobacteriota bacterium]